MATTPTINPSNADSSTAGGHFLVPHKHNFNSIIGLRFGPNGRVEPVYDSADVYANGQVIALYNAATPKTSFTAPTVPFVTIVDAVKNNDGDDTSLGKAQADKFLAEGRITQREYAEITKEVKPTGDGVKAGAPKSGTDVAAVTGDINFDTVLTPGGTTLGDMIKKVTFPRTIEQLGQGYPGMTPAQIVNNLAGLAANIYEPLKRQYPRAFITNSFRHGASIGGGQHGTGQAMDVQIRGLSSNDYINVAEWINKNLPYDQLLLEYLPNKTVWIHVSYAIPGLPNGGLSVTKNKPQNRLATLNGAAGGKFVPNLHADIVAAAVPNRVVAA
jgi:hypothetical protein